jgi:flagellar basal-body rod modification protein FlgD
MSDPYQQKEMFLKLLVAQLKNQDPTSPMDQKDMLGQMAQFSTVEQLTNLSKTMEGMSFSSSVNLLGKTVSYTSTDAQGNATLVRGVTVTGLSSKDGKITLELSDGAQVAPDRLAQVEAA